MATNFTNVGSTFMGWDIAVINARLGEIITPATLKATPLAAFSTYFSDIPSPSGIISVPLVTYPTSADSLNNGMVITSATASVANLTVNNDIGKFFPFNPANAQQYGLDNLLKTWLVPAMYACDRTLSSASLAIALNSSNFATSSIHMASGSNFTVANAGLIQADLSNTGINGERIIVASPNYYWGLITNIASAGNAAGAAALQSGSPNNPLGVSVIEGQDFASGNIIGFAGNKAAIAVGTALPNVLHLNGSTVKLTSPQTGVNYLAETYYDEVNRQWLIGCSVVYGAAKVQSTIKQLTQV
jgi:hypothetical protein